MDEFLDHLAEKLNEMFKNHQSGGRFSKDPVTYRARKAMLGTVIHLP